MSGTTSGVTFGWPAPNASGASGERPSGMTESTREDSTHARSTPAPTIPVAPVTITVSPTYRIVGVAGARGRPRTPATAGVETPSGADHHRFPVVGGDRVALVVDHGGRTTDEQEDQHRA